MDKIKIKELRDHIAALPPEQFDMSQWRAERECGTVACLAGWTVELNKSLFGDWLERSDIKGAARLVLQLSQLEANRLFVPIEASILRHPNHPGAVLGDLNDVTTEQAVKVLDHLLETGEVDWRVSWPDDEVL